MASRNKPHSGFVPLEVEVTSQERRRGSDEADSSWKHLVPESPATVRRRPVRRKGGMMLGYMIAGCILAAVCLWAWSAVLAVQQVVPRLRGSANKLRADAPGRVRPAVQYAEPYTTASTETTPVVRDPNSGALVPVSQPASSTVEPATAGPLVGPLPLK
mmetsp:Transcript_28644/g.52134  ORF Transcript_28644/g.52134 Transcript_28644/m.52134 type:complete len:159 (+) Transcript_28644:103-579(+)